MSTNRINRRLASHVLWASACLAAAASALPASAQHDVRAGAGATADRRPLNPQPLPPRHDATGSVQQRGIIIVGGRQGGNATGLQPVQQPQPRIQSARSSELSRTAPSGR